MKKAKHFTVIVGGNYISLKAKNHTDALSKARAGKGKCLAAYLKNPSVVKVKRGYMTYGEIAEARS